MWDELAVALKRVVTGCYTTNAPSDNETQILLNRIPLSYKALKYSVSKSLSGFVIDGFRSVHSRCLRLAGSDLLALLTESLRPLPADRPRILPAVSAPADVLTAVRLGFDLFDGAFPLLLTEAGWAWNFDPERPEEEWLDFRDPR